MRVEEVSILGTDGTAVVVYEKRLSTRERGEPEATARLRGEAELLAALGGRVTPALVGTGEDERGPWLRTEKVPFPTLAQRLDEAARRGTTALDIAWIERAVRVAYAALAELHEAADFRGALQIVHADLSPANVAVDDDGGTRGALDLDLATWRGAAARDGAFRGTVAYVRPGDRARRGAVARERRLRDGGDVPPRDHGSITARRARRSRRSSRPPPSARSSMPSEARSAPSSSPRAAPRTPRSPLPRPSPAASARRRRARSWSCSCERVRSARGHVC